MSKCAALIELGWMKRWFEAEDACGIVDEVGKVQSFSCILMMGRANEGKAGQKQLDKLEKFLEKYRNGTLTMKDIEKLNIHLACGDIVCYMIAEGEEMVEALKGIG